MSGPLAVDALLSDLTPARIDNLTDFMTQCGRCIVGGALKLWLHFHTIVETVNFFERTIQVGETSESNG